ncbi:MAG: glycosyl hydrolase [Mangrovibacterium sp.]
MRERLPEFCEGVETVMAMGYGLDYISDRFIATTEVKNGMLVTEGGASYKAMILPSVNLIPLETMQKVSKLIEQGATVIFKDHVPSDVLDLPNLKSEELHSKPRSRNFQLFHQQRKN